MGGIIWDPGGNFSKFIDRAGSHQGASHRGTWTGCVLYFTFQLNYDQTMSTCWCREWHAISITADIVILHLLSFDLGDWPFSIIHTFLNKIPLDTMTPTSLRISKIDLVSFQQHVCWILRDMVYDPLNYLKTKLSCSLFLAFIFLYSIISA